MQSPRWQSHEPAYLRRRFFAAIVDHIIAIPLTQFLVHLLVLGIGPLSHGYQLLWSQALYPLYFFVTAGLFSTSLGKVMLGMTIVHQTTGQRLTWKDAFFREVLGRQLNAYLFPVGLVGVRRRYSRAQTIADEVGKTVVVRKRKQPS